MQEEYNYSLSDAKKFAAEAFSRIEREKLPPIPEIFEVFFSYYSKNHPEIVRSIDIMVSQKFELRFERCKELHKRLLSSNRNTETLLKAEQIVGQTLGDVGEMFDSVKLSNKDFSGSIEEINKNITTAVDPESLKSLLISVMSETQKMVSENTVLEQKLEKSSSTMQQLKEEMEAVRMEAYTDALTSIPNRKKFDIEIVRLVAESRNDKEPLCSIFLDIDHFKSFNDVYGHQIGDQVLRLVARTLKESIKGQDFACRYGGEEFVILLPKTDQEGARKIAEILRETVKSKEIRNRKTGEVLTRVTISAGVAMLDDNEDIPAWIARADKALYQAKRKGRDRVIVAE